MTTRLTILCLFYAVFSVGQSDNHILQVVHQFFDAMESKDTTTLKRIMHPQCQIFSTLSKNGQPRVEMLRRVSFIGFMKRAMDKKYIYDEQLWSYDVQKEDNLATLRAEYTLFVGKVPKISHCGINQFTLALNSDSVWQIINIADTRRMHHCIDSATVQQQSAVINNLLNDWHKAAAEADTEAYFGFMSDDAVYLGTDASERWTKKEFVEWAAPHFEKSEAWTFLSNNRQLYFSANKRTVWFEERLDTWMGPCRASGVLTRKQDTWQLQHYNLAMMVPNALVSKFAKLVEKEQKKQQK